MPAQPKPRVPHLRDGLIVAKPRIVRSTTAPAHDAGISKAEVAN
jgi:hypothetical protein